MSLLDWPRATRPSTAGLTRRQSECNEPLALLLSLRTALRLQGRVCDRSPIDLDQVRPGAVQQEPLGIGVVSFAAAQRNADVERRRDVDDERNLVLDTEHGVELAVERQRVKLVS